VRLSKKLLSKESGTKKIDVFDNPDYFEWILCFTCKMTCMPLRLIILIFIVYSAIIYNIINKNFVTILF
jgi:hypothetical protein